MINFVTYTKPLEHVKLDWTKTSAAKQQNGQNPGRSGHCRVYTSLAFLSSCSDLRAGAGRIYIYIYIYIYMQTRLCRPEEFREQVSS